MTRPIDTVNYISKRQRQQATFGAPLDAIIENLYSIALWDIELNDVIIAPDLDPAKLRTQAAEYNFSVPPKIHEMKEPFSTTIIPTQNGGKYIESQGSILKSVRLQGTTGLRPHKGAPFAIPLLGGITDSLDVLSFSRIADFSNRTTLDATEITGYDDILFLRNLFRHYSDIKESGAGARYTAMLWRNAKDNDYWIVEPMEFQLSQSSSSPVTYEYSIELRTLSKMDFTVTFNDPIDLMRNIRRLTFRLQEYSQTLKRAFLTVSTQIRRAEGAGIFITNTVMAPLLNVLRGLNDIKAGIDSFGEALNYNAVQLSNNLQEELEKLEGNDSFPAQDPLKRELRRISVVAYSILADPGLQETARTSQAVKQKNITKAYSRGVRVLSSATPPPGGHPGAGGTGETVASGTVHTGEDIRDLAGRLTGTRSSWHIIAMLNSLRAPYITATGEPGTLAPGDSVLYPSRAGVGVSSNEVNPSSDETENQDEKLLSPTHRAYGRDLRLRTVSEGVTDLAINQRGDLSTIVGIPNVEQAIKIKFATEQGELPAHPLFGARFSIGSKATPKAFNEFHINTRSTLLSDVRIKKIKELEFQTTGDVLLVHSKLELNDSVDLLAVNFALRRF